MCPPLHTNATYPLIRGEDGQWYDHRGRVVHVVADAPILEIKYNRNPRPLAPYPLTLTRTLTTALEHTAQIRLELFGAVARDYCTTENSGKVLDPVLIEGIVAEVGQVVRARCPDCGDAEEGRE